MTTTLTTENPIYLDEVKISQLGPTRKRYLKEWFHVDTIQGLAALAADDIESKFKREGQIVSRSWIESWILEAQELASAANLASQQAVESADAEAGEKANSPATESEWKPFHAFWVEFQRRETEGRAEERIEVSHVPVEHGAWLEDKRTEPTVIPGERLHQWMQNQVSERMPQVPEPPEEKPPMEAQPAEALPVTVEMAQVQAFQPPQAETPIAIGRAGQPFSGFVRSSEPFALKASFEPLVPAAAQVAKKQVTYRAQFHARNLSTTEKIPLGDTKAVSPVEGEAPYMALLPQTSLQPGVYNLRVLVTLQSTPPSVGYLEVPLLQVV